MFWFFFSKSNELSHLVVYQLCGDCGGSFCLWIQGDRIHIQWRQCIFGSKDMHLFDISQILFQSYFCISTTKLYDLDLYGHTRGCFLSLQQMMSGLLFASVVFCADLYFLIREASWQMENSVLMITFVCHFNRTKFVR